MKYPAFSRKKERNDHVKANRRSSSDWGHLGFQFRTWGKIGNSRRAQLFRPCGSDRRPPPNSDELRRRRAKDRAALCSWRLLLLSQNSFLQRAILWRSREKSWADHKV